MWKNSMLFIKIFSFILITVFLRSQGFSSAPTWQVWSHRFNLRKKKLILFFAKSCWWGHLWYHSTLYFSKYFQKQNTVEKDDYSYLQSCGEYWYKLELRSQSYILYPDINLKVNSKSRKFLWRLKLSQVFDIFLFFQNDINLPKEDFIWWGRVLEKKRERRNRTKIQFKTSYKNSQDFAYVLYQF